MANHLLTWRIEHPSSQTLKSKTLLTSSAPAASTVERGHLVLVKFATGPKQPKNLKQGSPHEWCDSLRLSKARQRERTRERERKRERKRERESQLQGTGTNIFQPDYGTMGGCENSGLNLKYPDGTTCLSQHPNRCQCWLHQQRMRTNHHENVRPLFYGTSLGCLFGKPDLLASVLLLF